MKKDILWMCQDCGFEKVVHSLELTKYDGQYLSLICQGCNKQTIHKKVRK